MMRIGRRTLLGTGAAWALAPRTTRAADDGWSVEIELDGKTVRYDQAAGRDVGSFISPIGGFEQGCVRVERPDLPMTVFFRPDRGDTRMEVVVEHGRIWSGPATNLGPYRAVLRQGSETRAVVELPRHDWRARWRWQSKERPLLRTPDELMREGLIPAYKTIDSAHMEQQEKFPPYTPMGLAGVTAYMPTTGERNDIGPVTDIQGRWICTEGSRERQQFMAQAEAAGTVPWHFRDEKTGAPIDLNTYPNASSYNERAGKPAIPNPDKTIVTADSSHQPALAYLPYLLTGDPYHLETLQFQANYDNLAEPPGYKLRINQIRANAWLLRNLGQVALVTPANVPSWMQPQRYWQGALTRWRDWLRHDFVDSREPPRAIFRTTSMDFGDRDAGSVPAGTQIAPWQEEFQAYIFGWLAQLGHPGWDEVFRWKLGSTIARTDGTSGWNRALAVSSMLMLRPRVNQPWVTSWAEAWRLNQAVQNWPEPDGSDRWAGEYVSYLAYARGALALALQQGIAEAGPSFAWADREVRRLLSRENKQMSYKWCIAPERAATAISERRI